MNRNSKRGDVWISAVLYILIGLAIMGLLLMVVRPKIEQMRDTITIDQTISTMNRLDETISRTREAPGTRLEYLLQLSKGTVEINAVSNSITWTIDSSVARSEINKPINVGSIKMLTTPISADRWGVSLTLNYTNMFNLTYNGNDENKVLGEAKIPYDLWIENRGVFSGRQQIDTFIS